MCALFNDSLSSFLSHSSMDSNGTETKNHLEIEQQFLLDVLSLDEKLKIATETLITNKLKDNHDDTLFGKFCSLLQSDIQVEQLIKFVDKQNIFALIDANLPRFENADLVGKHRDDTVAFFRILGALLSHQQIFNLYIAGHKEIFNVAQILSQLFEFLMDQSCQDPKLLALSLLSFIKSVSSHKAGAQWLLSLWFENPGERESSKFGMDFIQFVKHETSHYVQKEICSILANLSDLMLMDYDGSLWLSSLHEKFCLTLNKHLLTDFNLSACKLMIETLKTVSNKQPFIRQHNLVDFSVRSLKCTNLNEADLNCLTKLISLIVCSDASLYHVIDLAIAALRSPNRFFMLVSLLNLIVNINHSNEEFGCNRALWLSLIIKMISLVRHHYDGAAELPEADIAADHGQLVMQVFHSMPYASFESQCFKILNKIDCTLINSHDALLLTMSLRPLIRITKVTNNRKHAIFLLTFFNEAAKTKCDQPELISEILSIYFQILIELPQHKSLVLTSLRTIFQHSSTTITCSTILERICPIMEYFVQYLGEVEPSDDNELTDIIVETIFNLLLHLDLVQIADLSSNCTDLVKQLIDLETAWLLCSNNNNLEPSIHANIVSSLYTIFRYHFKSHSPVAMSLNESSLEQLVATSPQQDCTYRQTLYCNLKSLLTINATTASEAECCFLLPLLCKLCIAENDPELECILLQMIELTSGSYLMSHHDNPAKSAQLFLDAGLFNLIHSLLGEPLTLYRTKMATLNLHQNVCAPLMAQLAEQCSSNFTDLKFGSAIKGVLKETAFEYCKGSTDQLRQSVEQQRDCPQVSILDDIISTSLITDDMVMDCY